MKIISEFKEFALKGNIIDFAVGIIIGAVFNSVVDSLVKDIIMPPIGWLLGKADFSDLYINLSGGTFDTLKSAQEAGAVTINYGLFINALISFLITAWVVFLVVKAINKLLRQHEAKEDKTPTTRACPFCTKEIAKKATKCPFCTADVEQM
jgi:large conductance mechanosensitive channel